MTKPLLSIQEILTLLPHRYPFLLIDRILELELGRSVTALKNVTVNEAQFVGHFPNKPVMPGVLMLEAMAQAGAVLAYRSYGTLPDSGELYYLAGIDNARFKRVVEPGDQLILKVTVVKAKESIWKLSGSAYVGDELVCSADFLSARKTAEGNRA